LGLKTLGGHDARSPPRFFDRLDIPIGPAQFLNTGYTGVVAARRDLMDLRYGFGHQALDLAATLGSRLDQPFERLQSPDLLARWFVDAGLLERPPSVDKTLLEETRELREAIYRLIDAARHGKSGPASDVAVLNAWARQPTAAPQTSTNFDRSDVAADPARAAIARLARETVNLLTGPDVTRVRRCARTGCPLLFLDLSRPGRRQWCSMERCGNLVKTARYRHSRAGGKH
jgi:predicted RNA-binding Zn ribbon-like protein